MKWWSMFQISALEPYYHQPSTTILRVYFAMIIYLWLISLTKLLMVDYNTDLEQIVYNSDHHFLVTLSQNCQLPIRTGEVTRPATGSIVSHSSHFLQMVGTYHSWVSQWNGMRSLSWLIYIMTRDKIELKVIAPQAQSHWSPKKKK